LREVFCPVLEFRKEKRSFAKVEGCKVNFFSFLVRPADFWVGYFFGPNIENMPKPSQSLNCYFSCLFYFLDLIPNPKGKVASKQGDDTFPKKARG